MRISSRCAVTKRRSPPRPAGKFGDEIVPVPVDFASPDAQSKTQHHEVTFDIDEGPRSDTSFEALAKLKPVFHAKGTVTAGNSSQMSDGAAAAVVMSAEKAAALGIRPLARFVSYAYAGCPPEEMGIGPVYAIPKALKLAGLNLERHRRNRIERSLRRAIAGCYAHARPESGQSQRKRRRHRARTSAGMYGRQADRQRPSRTEAHERTVWHGDDVRRRRHGRRGHFRESELTRKDHGNEYDGDHIASR